MGAIVEFVKAMTLPTAAGPEDTENVPAAAMRVLGIIEFLLQGVVVLPAEELVVVVQTLPG